MGFWAASFFIGQFISPLTISIFRNLTGGLLPAVAIFGAISIVAMVVCFVSMGRKK